MVERVIGDQAVLVRRFLSEIRDYGVAAASRGGRLSLAISGGSVATTFLPALAQDPGAIDWHRSDLFWADERAVSPTDPDSNYGVAKSLWLDPARVPEARVHRMQADLPDLEQACHLYTGALEQAAGTPPVLDVVLLGIGPDGHVAWLFAGHRLLNDTTRLVASLDDSPKPPPRRMTLTLPVITSARLVLIGAFGAAKAANVKDAIENPHSTLPAGIVSRSTGRAVWLLDAAAAGQLKP